MTPEPLAVDVIVNNHNYGRFLSVAVASALGQRHPNTRVIVVDDGSTDDSREVIAGFGDLVQAMLKPNGGQASALNAGFAASTGDVVIFLDADDVLLPDTAGRVAEVFSHVPDTAKVQYRMRVVDALGRPSGQLKPPPHIPLPSGDLRTRELAAPFDMPWVPTSGTAYSAAYLRRVMPMPDSGEPVGADWYLTHLAALWGPVQSLDDVGALYRVHGKNAYEPNRTQLDLDQLRQTIVLADATRRQLAQFADELGLHHPRSIIAVSDVANRLISLRLDPDRHPLPNDRIPALLSEAIGATHRRADVHWPMRIVFLGWFAGMAVAPRPAARPLAELFVFPGRRRSLNGALRRLHRGRGG